jgi:zinc D-Ala-D-Ala carboxypeptidase
MGKYAFFTDQEVQGLDDALCQMLSVARGKANVPFVITCGLRTASQNASLAESVSDSAHLTGHAVDLACNDSPTRFSMLQGLLAAGFNRIGVYSAHLHVDNDTTKPPNVIWYVSGT